MKFNKKEAERSEGLCLRQTSVSLHEKEIDRLMARLEYTLDEEVYPQLYKMTQYP